MASPERPRRPVHLAVALPQAGREVFRAHFDLVSQEEAVAVVIRGSQTVGHAELDAFPKLERIACIGTGHDGVDVAAAKARGISVATTAGANARAVAEFALTLMLASGRDLTQAMAYVADEGWKRQEPPPGVSAPGLDGQRVGVVGLGAVGWRVAALSEAFGATVGWIGPRPKPDAPWRRHEDLDALANWADVLVLCHQTSPVDPPIITTDTLARLGPTGRLINVARGSAVDEVALVEALQTEALGGAALDVFEHEPQASEALRSAPRLILSPHIAGGSQSGLNAMLLATSNSLSAWFAEREGQPLGTLGVGIPTTGDSAMG